MKTLILNFSNNISFIPNEKGLTMSCIEICENKLKEVECEYEYICIKELEKTEYGDRIIYTCDYK